jgi:hypothetical protein
VSLFKNCIRDKICTVLNTNLQLDIISWSTYSHRKRSMGTKLPPKNQDDQVPAIACGANSAEPMSDVDSCASMLSGSSRRSRFSQSNSLGSSCSNGSSKSKPSGTRPRLLLAASQQRRDDRKALKANLEQERKKKEAERPHSGPFSVHALGVEAMSIGYVSAMIGSMVMDPRKDKQMQMAKKDSDDLLRALRRNGSSTPMSPTTPILKENEPHTPAARAQSTFDSRPHDQTTVRKQKPVGNEDLDSLPPPREATEKKIADYRRSRSTTSAPVELPTRTLGRDNTRTVIAESAEDTEYQARVFDLRTWDMYQLINEARSKQKHPPYEPPADHQGCASDRRYSQSETMSTSSSSHTNNMIFSFDME